MNQASDILQTHNVSGLQFNNGIASGWSNAGNDDPELIFRGPDSFPIDPSQYYYFTYKMRDPLPMDVTRGSVSRIFWSDLGSQYFTAATSRDIIIYEGWKEVTIDLRKAKLEPGGTPWLAGARDGLRLDPHEFSTPRYFELDDVKLTRNDSANTSYRINHLVSDNDDGVRSIEFRYSLNADGSNSQPISCVTGPVQQPIPGLNNRIYLPLVLQNQPGVCTWNSSAVPNGDYYIVMIARDAYDQTVRVSETPVEIRH